MSTAETPLVDILAQLRERAEHWTREASAARTALAEEVAAACRTLETAAPATGNSPDSAPGDFSAPAVSGTPPEEVAALLAAARAEFADERDALQGALSATESHRAALERELNRMGDEMDAMRAALDQAERIAKATPVVDEEARAALAQAQSALALAAEEHAEALATRDEQIAALEATVEAQSAQLAAVHTELRLAAIRAEAERALVEQDIRAFDQHGHKRRMGVILVEAGVITQDQLEEILAEQAQNPQRRFGTIVVERGFTSEEAVARILAAQLRLPFLALTAESCDPGVAARISGHLARLHKALPVREENGNLTVAMVNPLDLIAIEDIEIASRCRVEPVVATRSAIEAILATRA